jgi:hypothetical protein
MSRPREQSSELLVIVPCGLLKIWDRYPEAGPTAAADAYIGPPFKVNRRYAERAGGDWEVLSAKYGLLRPTDIVPGPYNTTFKRRSTNPIGVAALRKQVEQMGLDRYRDVIGLGIPRRHRCSLRRRRDAAQLPLCRAAYWQSDARYEAGHARVTAAIQGLVRHVAVGSGLGYC